MSMSPLMLPLNPTGELLIDVVWGGLLVVMVWFAQ